GRHPRSGSSPRGAASGRAPPRAGRAARRPTRRTARLRRHRARSGRRAGSSRQPIIGAHHAWRRTRRGRRTVAHGTRCVACCSEPRMPACTNPVALAAVFATRRPPRGHGCRSDRMVRFLIVDMHTLWLIGGVIALATAGALVFLRSLHHPSTNALGLHALALALGGAGLIGAGLASDAAGSTVPAIADTMIAGSVMLACEAVRRLFGAAPRPALLIALLFVLVAGCLGFDTLRSDAAARIAYTSVLVATVSSLTAVRIARAQDPSAESLRRLLVAAGLVNALVWLLRSGLAVDALGLPEARIEPAGALEVVAASLVVLLPALVTSLILMTVHARMADEL